MPGQYTSYGCVAEAPVPDIALIKSELVLSLFCTGCRRLLDLILNALFSSAASPDASPSAPFALLRQCKRCSCRTM